jgi:hypothetical protein
VRRRATFLLAVVAALAWCCLLFGIGLDDLTNGDTKPGVIFAIVLLTILIGGLLAGIVRLGGIRAFKRLLRLR